MMAFVTEYISEEDIKKYEINKWLTMFSSPMQSKNIKKDDEYWKNFWIYKWVIDHDNKVFLTRVGSLYETCKEFNFIQCLGH